MAWLIAEDDGAKKKVVTFLAERDEDLSLVRGTLQGWFDHLSKDSEMLTLQEQLDGIDEGEPGQKDLKDMLSTLLQFL